MTTYMKKLREAHAPFVTSVNPWTPVSTVVCCDYVDDCRVIEKSAIPTCAMQAARANPTNSSYCSNWPRWRLTTGVKKVSRNSSRQISLTYSTHNAFSSVKSCLRRLRLKGDASLSEFQSWSHGLIRPQLWGLRVLPIRQILSWESAKRASAIWQVTNVEAPGQSGKHKTPEADIYTGFTDLETNPYCTQIKQNWQIRTLFRTWNADSCIIYETCIY